jgi:hypothetical protein
VTDARARVPASSGGGEQNHQRIATALCDLAAAWPTTADMVAAMRVSNNAQAQVEWLDQCERRIRQGENCWAAPETQFRADDIVRSLATWIWVRLANRKLATTVKVTDRLQQMMCERAHTTAAPSDNPPPPPSRTRHTHTPTRAARAHTHTRTPTHTHTHTPTDLTRTEAPLDHTHNVPKGRPADMKREMR